MNNRVAFIADFPLSGSAIICSLLGQRNDCSLKENSALESLVFASKTNDANVLNNIFFNMHEFGKLAIDSNLEWATQNGLQFAKYVFKQPVKIVATVRNIEDIVSSYVLLKNPKDLTDFINNDQEIKNLEYAYKSLLGYYQAEPSNILFVDYNNLIDDPAIELQKIENFLGLSEHNYDTGKVVTSALYEQKQKTGSFDRKLLGSIENQKELLGYHYYKFCQARFWLGEDTVKERHPIDESLKLGITGNQDQAKQLLDKIVQEEPDNHRAAFNYGWYLIKEGKLLEGHKNIYRGRHEHVFGNRCPIKDTPMWDGKSKGDVLLNLEGGLGDQIHGAGMVKYIKARGCDVIVACSKELAPILKNVDGIKTIVTHAGAGEILCDYWVPSMSAIIPLGLEYKDVDGSAYIQKPKLIRGGKFRIGLRWQGNPQFEHEQHRVFPSKLLFDALQEFDDVEFVSLQRDEGAENRPNWVRQVPLNNWIETQHAIASCDLVISSCTSVAHMSAAMGVDTWIVIPVLPYYLWAKPGSKTEWYDSVTLFRQETYGDWKAPFVKINHELKLKLGERNAYQNRLLGSSGQRECGAVLGLQTSTG